MTIVIISLLTVCAMGFGFSFGRSYQIEREIERRVRDRPMPVIDLHPGEWERAI